MLHATEHTIHESVENVREQGNEKRKIESHKYFMWENSHKSLGASKKIFAFDLRGGKGQVEGCTKVSKKAEARAHTHTHHHLPPGYHMPVCHQYSLPPSFIPSHAREIGNRNTRSSHISCARMEERRLLMNIEESWCLSSFVFCALLLVRL